MSTSRQNRRRFLQQSLSLSAAAASTPLWFDTRAQAASKNDRPIIGCIGLGGQGTGIAQRASAFGDIVAVCDVDREHAEAAREKFGGKADIHEDYRKVLDRNDIEAVTIGTPDHWHTAIALAALHSGKDVYCEKPLTLTVEEGKAILRDSGLKVAFADTIEEAAQAVDGAR